MHNTRSLHLQRNCPGNCKWSEQWVNLNLLIWRNCAANESMCQWSISVTEFKQSTCQSQRAWGSVKNSLSIKHYGLWHTGEHPKGNTYIWYRLELRRNMVTLRLWGKEPAWDSKSLINIQRTLNQGKAKEPEGSGGRTGNGKHVYNILTFQSDKNVDHCLQTDFTLERELANSWQGRQGVTNGRSSCNTGNH